MLSAQKIVAKKLLAPVNRMAFASKDHYYKIMPNLDETRTDLMQMVESFGEAEVKPLADEMDKSMKFPHHMWKRMGDQGLLGITAAEEYGGLGLGYYEHCLCVEQLSKANAGFALSYLAHSNLCVNQFEHNASEAQKAKYLPGLCAGDLVGALAMSEPNSGSDVTSMQLKAEKKGDKYILNGSKMWITNGPTADVIWVYAKTDMNAGHKGISTFIIEKDFPGFSIAQKLDKLGMRGSETGELVFEDCEVPAENLVAQEGSGVYIMMKGLDSERLILSAGALGIHQAAMDEASTYTSDRKQFGKKLIE